MKSDIIQAMANAKDDIGYDLNEADIDAVLRYMELNDPVIASADRAIRFLVTWKKNLRERDTESPLESELDTFYKKFIEDDLKNNQ